jgi:prepilin-type processing-associated H-X9-DG protein
MDENLIGYLLDALDPETQREVEAYLHRDPRGRQRLAELRQALAPLAADRDTIEPPPTLVVRTLARVAEHCSRELPRAPAALGRGGAGSRPFWRRADALVAASILLVAVGLGVTGLLGFRESHDLVACQNNLREFYQALWHYSEQHHGQFPNVADSRPRDVAGLVVPILTSAGQLPRGATYRCPASSEQAAPTLTLEQVRDLTDEEFQRLAPRLACCYGYSLGYRDADGVCHGPRFDPADPNAQLPLMSDCPPVDLALGNSRNHGGRGQNVLFMDGHVRFCTTRNVGVNGDDIFVNWDNRVEAGRDALDTVLGRSNAHPTQGEE